MDGNRSRVIFSLVFIFVFMGIGVDGGEKDMTHTVIQQIESYSYATRLAFASSAGATSLVLRAPVLGMVGETIEIDPITNREQRVVTAVQDSTISFSMGLTYAYPAGTVVKRVLNTDSSGYRELFIPVSGSYNTTASATLVRTDTDAEGWPMPDAVVSYAFGDFKVPVDYKEGGVLDVVLVSNADGNVYGTLSVDFGASGEHWDAHSETSSAGADGITALHISRSTRKVTFSALAKGDFVSVQYSRAAVNALDTVDNIVYIKGFLFTYKADD